MRGPTGTTARRRPEDETIVGLSIRDGIMVCSPAGPLGPPLAAAVQRALLAALATHPIAVVCDLSRVTSIDPVCAGVFTVLRHPALGRSGTTLLLCGARPAVRRVLVARGVPRHVTLLDDLPGALARAGLGPRRLGERLVLEPTATAPATASGFAADVCDHWGLGVLAAPAAIAAASLVAGAVSAGGAGMELSLRVDRHRLQVELHEQDGDLVPVLLRHDRLADGMWGTRRDPAGGRTVWCSLELPD